MNAHRLQVKSLYKRSLKLSLDWIIQRDIWRQEALHIRHQFEQNRNVTNPVEIKALMLATEQKLLDWQHPDHYKLPLGPEGTKWERNLPPIVDGPAAEHH
ncbi:hypothetical protein [Absidia glauca]|uniref:NADH dehydrogenase [ubiquinone] 1 beta subcomplex subunit 9 n=1 Tax=Absidia glauca TaxID=4829 RepID=A0A163JT47_ABSGL|nr:hypothetical protein [Absidia glauca]